MAADQRSSSNRKAPGGVQGPPPIKKWVRWSVPAAALVIVVGFAVLVPRGVSAPATAPPKPATRAPAAPPTAATPTPSATAETVATPVATPTTSSATAFTPTSASTTPDPGGEKPKEIAPGILVPPGRSVTYIRGQGPPPTDRPGVSTTLKPAPLDQMEKQRERI